MTANAAISQGKPIGGAASKRGKDKRPRETEGYKQAWARRKAARSPTTLPRVTY